MLLKVKVPKLTAEKQGMKEPSPPKKTVRIGEGALQIRLAPNGLDDLTIFSTTIKTFLDESNGGSPNSLN